MESKELIEKIKFNVIQGRINSEDDGFDEGHEGEPAVVELVEEALKSDVSIKEIVTVALTGGMKTVGSYFEEGKYLIPDMLAAAEAVGAAMEILEPHFQEAGVKSRGVVVLATVAGDLHDIGKNIVGIMFKGAGYNVIDLGTDVPVEKIIETAKAKKANFIGLSALLTTTMWRMEDVIKGLEKIGIRKDVKVLIGGAPTSEDFASKLGADRYCPDAFQGINFAESVVTAGS